MEFTEITIETILVHVVKYVFALFSLAVAIGVVLGVMYWRGVPITPDVIHQAKEYFLAGVIGGAIWMVESYIYMAIAALVMSV